LRGRSPSIEISESSVAAEDVTIPIAPRDADKLELTEAESRPVSSVASQIF